MLSLSALASTGVEIALFPVLISLSLVQTLAQYAARGFQPRFPKWTLRFEVARALKRFVTERYGDALATEPSAGRFRRLTEIVGSAAGWLSCRRHQTAVTPETAHGLEHLWIKSVDSDTRPPAADRFVVLYYHGGGYAVYSPRYFIDFCNTLRAAIVRELKATTPALAAPIEVDFFVANYRKTPVHKFPAPAQDAVLMYEYLVAHHNVPPRNIIVAGDSAGGGLVLSTLLGLRDAGKQELQPLAAMVCCAYADFMEEPEEFVPPPHCGLSQRLMRAFRVAALADPSDPAEARRHSPVFADLRGLPPVLVQAASLDYIYQNSLDLLAKAAADGVRNWEADLHDGVPHVFTTTAPSVLPYAAVGLQRLAAFAAKHILSSRAVAK
ncbi:hypothetical protein PybrP1_012182 [[Pythium] brassicae (nom. inval.)]|nr:hypothetical protein PybrP1_012182 [[Pythium] brassicae (nom. inval.)]